MLIALTLAIAILGQTTPPSLAAVRSIHIAGMTDMLGPDRQVAACFVEKMKAQGPFTFPDTPESAQAVLTFTSKLPSGSSRVLWGKSPEVKAQLKTRDGQTLWTGANKYKKSTTAWGASTDIPCGLANGLVNKLVKDIQKTKPASTATR